MCRARLPGRTRPPSRCAVRTTARPPASKRAVRRTGNALRRAHDRYDMRGAAPQHTAPATRSDSPFLSMSLHAADALVVLAKFVRASGTGSTAKRVPCGANRSGKSVTAGHGRSRGSQLWGNVSGTYPYSAGHAGTRDLIHRASRSGRMPERGWTAVSACKAPLWSIESAEHIEETLQKCDLAPAARDADTQSCETRKDEYRCVRMHLVRVARGKRYASRSANRPASSTV